MEYRLGELASASGAELRGDPELLIRGLAPLPSAGPGELSFLANPAYRRFLATTSAAAVIVHPALADASPVAALISPDPYLAFARLSRLFDHRPLPQAGVDAHASVSASARVDRSASVGAGCVLEDDVEIGAGTVLGPGCHVGRGSRIGRDCRLWSNVVVYHGVHLGDRVVVHAGSVIGSDGFGYAASDEGWVRIAQLGGVLIGDDVDIGANTTIDRGAIEDTVIEDGVKLDNLVQVGHNVAVGEHCILCGQVGIAGSAKIGNRVVLAGQTGVNDNIFVGDDVIAGGGTKIFTNAPAGRVLLGYPAVKMETHLDIQKALRRLPRLAAAVAALQKAVSKGGGTD